MGRKSNSRCRAASQSAACILGVSYPGRRAPRVALALGYYRPPCSGLHLAATQTVGTDAVPLALLGKHLFAVDNHG
jgi:hypothetical protein